MKMGRAFLLFLLSVAGSLSFCRAQNSFGTIVGTVQDQAGAAVNNAPIRIQNTATGVVTMVRTQPDGNYTAINLIPGFYVVSTEVEGFAKAVTPPTELVVNQNLRLNMVLHPGTVAQTVQVTTQSVLLDTDSAAISQEISNREVNDLPLVSRNVLNLVALSPGVVADTTGRIGGDQSEWRSTLSGGDMYVGGGRGSSNGYLIDGVDNNDPGFQTPTITPPIPSVQEFRLMSKNYTAEYGGSADQVNIATKSGTNDFHGTIYDFIRNDAVDAVPDFSPKDPVTGRAKPVLRYNQFGATVGGPVLVPHVVNGRNRLFFFGAYEGLRSHSVASAFAIFPTANELAGNFAGDPTIYNPATGLPFSGNKITTIDPKAQALINAGLFKTTYSNAIPGFNAVTRVSAPDSIDNYMIRVDAHMGPNNSLFARFSASNENRLEPSIYPFGGSTAQQSGKNIAVDYTHIFTTNLINDLHFGLNRPIAKQEQEGANTTDINSLFANTATDPATWGAPYTYLYGIGTFGGGAVGPLNFITTDAKLSDVVTWIHGPHTFAIGADVGKLRFKETDSLEQRGLLVFFGFYTSGALNPSGNAFADFLLGDTYEGLVISGNSTGWYDSWGEGAFLQDNWKVNGRLTLNLGLRYDYQSPFRDENNQVSSVDFNYPGGRFLTPNAAAVAAAHNPLIAYTPARDLVEPTRNAWQPRIGLSYRPFGNTVIRSGYGIYFDSVEYNEYIFPVLNAPYAATSVAVAASPFGKNALSLDTMFPAAVAGRLGAYTLDRQNSHLPYVQQWNFDVEHELPGNMVMEVGYIGSEGTHLQDRRDPAQGQLISPGNVKFLYTNFSSILLTENAASSNYNALIARLDKHFSHGFSFRANYTWSKALGTVSSQGSIGSENSSGFQDAWNPRGDYGPLGYDVTHSLVIAPIYELPFGRGRMLAANAPAVVNAVIGGWQAEGIFTAHSGVPFSITATDASGTRAGGVPRASLVPGQNPFARTPGKAFNTNAFVQPAAGTFGNSGNNMMRGLGLNNTDFSLIKNTKLHDSLGFQLRFEAFNVFNQSDLGPYPSYNLAPANLFGTYNSVWKPGRILQGAVQINF